MRVVTSDSFPNYLVLMAGHTTLNHALVPCRRLRSTGRGNGAILRLSPSWGCPQHRKPLASLREFHRVSPLCSAASISLSSVGDLPSDGNGAQATVETLIAGARKKREEPSPHKLPPTPRTATLGDVLPYLARLALGETQLYWRVAGALLALVM